MNFRFDRGLIWIDADLEYDGNIYHIENCIIDTGSATTAVDIELVEFNYCGPTQIKRLSGIGGTQEVVSQNVGSIRFDNVKINDLNIEFGDLQNSYGINGGSLWIPGC